MTTNTRKPYDVGILGWWYGKNYGSILTYYGLNRTIVGMGRRVLMIHEPLGYSAYRVKWPDDILSMQFARRVGYEFTAQEHHSRLPALGEKVDTFVVGSDQLWNPLIGRVDDDLFLDFVPPGCRRVAYATSFGNSGTGKFKPDFVARHAPNLQKFDALSVREGYAVRTAADVFGVRADLVVDPVFLLPRENYAALAQQATFRTSGDYLATFFLDPTPEKIAVAVAIADKLGLRRIVVVPNPDEGLQAAAPLPGAERFGADRFELMPEAAPENFLHTYAQARYIVTDSFHGTAFAVIFGKPFSSIYNTKRGVDRFRNLMASLGFGDSRRVRETDTPEMIRDNPGVSLDIDVATAERHLATARATSLRWLAAALSPEGEGAGEFSAIRGTAPSLATGTDHVREWPRGTAEAPAFAGANGAWDIAPGPQGTRLTVRPGCAVRGNPAWCDLPMALSKGSAYRLAVTWTPRTTAPTVNLHVRNGLTGNFRVVGTLAMAGRGPGQRTDTADFTVAEEGFTQFSLGAVHFTGPDAGAEIASLTVQEIAPAEVRPAKGPAKPKGKGTERELAEALALKDNAQYVAHYARSATTRTLVAARARVMFHAHAIEKGLSRSDFRPGFGRIAVPSLAHEMNAWLAAGRDTADPFFRSAAAVMQAYFRRHAEVQCDVSEFHELFTPAVHALIAAAETAEGGVLSATADRESAPPVEAGRSFIDVVYGRRSVRDFLDRPVRTEDIRHAVQIAMQAPSVCNRQAARVHLFDDPGAIKAALDLQGGFGGYRMPPRLLLVTSDLSAFLFATERNQPFIDGGLFMMTLLLGLQQVGLGSCSLNTAMSAEREAAIRRILKIPENEVFIAFVAVGHYDGTILTPQSRRVPVDAVLVSHLTAAAAEA